jgi:hypothetical protein
LQHRLDSIVWPTRHREASLAANIWTHILSAQFDSKFKKLVDWFQQSAIQYQKRKYVNQPLWVLHSRNSDTFDDRAFSAAKSSNLHDFWKPNTVNRFHEAYHHKINSNWANKLKEMITGNKCAFKSNRV